MPPTPGPKRTYTRNSVASGLWVEKTLLPSITQPSPSRRATVFRSVTADPASGSLMPRLISISPPRSPGRKRAFCPGFAYSANVRIGPKFPA